MQKLLKSIKKIWNSEFRWPVIFLVIISLAAGYSLRSCSGDGQVYDHEEISLNDQSEFWT